MEGKTAPFESTLPLKDALALADRALDCREDGNDYGFLANARKIPLPPELALDIARSPFLGGRFLAERFGDQLADLEKYNAWDGT